MAVGTSVVWNPSGVLTPPSDVEDERISRGGCPGCNKILRDEGRILVAERVEPPEENGKGKRASEGKSKVP